MANEIYFGQRRDKQTARETIICRLAAGNFEDETVSVQNIIYCMAAEKFKYETNSIQMCFVEWKPRMLRTKEIQHENTSEWRGKKEGQKKINVSKTKISMQDRLSWPANWKSLDCNNMLTVDKT